jgi:hypothetical protein
MIWVDGTTVQTNSAGSMTCGVGPGGAGCFGFGTWGNASDYEARSGISRIVPRSAASTRRPSGQSYMPAVVVPIPIIAPVQGTACDGMGDQLLQFLSERALTMVRPHCLALLAGAALALIATPAAP